MSANEREKIADIVAEFREMVHKSVDGIIAVKADVIADRIEAAWNREHGNAAAMREALKKIIELTTPCEGVTSIELQVQDEALTALSAPPRIVDAYTDWHDALKAAIAKCESWKPTACLECPWFIPHTTGACLMRRLYSEAKNEREVNGDQK